MYKKLYLNCYRRFKIGVLGAALITGSSAVQAQKLIKSPTEQRAGIIETITVVGSIEASALEASKLKANAPNAMEVIDAEQLLQFNEQALGDALRRLPGVSFDGANRAREVRVRGLPGEYTQILINGRPMIDGESRRNFEVDRIPTGLVERVEVIRSPRAIYSGQGSAGTINIVLKNGVDYLSDSNLAIGAGYLENSGKQGEASFSHGTQIGPLETMLAGSLQQFRRSESKDEFEFATDNIPNGGVLEINERRFDQVNLVPRFALQTNTANRFELDPFYLRTKEFRDDIETRLEDNQMTIDRVSDEWRERIRESYGFRADWQRKLDAAVKLRVGVDWQKGKTDTKRDETRFNADGSINRERQRTELIDMALIRPEIALNISTGAHDINIGAGAELREHNETNSEIRNGKLRPPREDRIFAINEDILFAFAEDIWQLSERLDVTTGLRLENSDTNTTDFFGITSSQDATFLLPSLNAVFTVTPDTQIRLGVARTLRRPDLRSLSPAIDEQDGSAVEPDIQGNPNQQPESIWGLDIGADYYFFDKQGYVSLNLFRREFTDKIEFITENIDGRFIASPQNIGDASATGVELSGRISLDSAGLNTVSLWGNMTYADSRVEQVSGKPRRFFNQPDIIANIGADFFYTPWQTTFGISANHVAAINQTQRLTNYGFVEQSIEQRTRLDLSIKNQITEDIDMTISITNLLGQTEDRVEQIVDAEGVFETLTRTQEPTYRNVFARLKWRF